MKSILCFGDSNTWGLIPGKHERYAWGVRWTSILQMKLNGAECRVIEEGLCGRTTVFEDEGRAGRAGNAILPIILESHSPISLVILMLGTNDCKAAYGASVEQICQGIHQLLDQINSVSKECKVLLVSPIELGRDVWKPEYDQEFDPYSVEKSRQLGHAYEKIARDRNVAFLAAADYAKPSLVDMEHMDEAGHRELADAVWAKVAQLLAEEDESILEETGKAV